MVNAPYLLIDESIRMYGRVMMNAGRMIGLNFFPKGTAKTIVTRSATPVNGNKTWDMLFAPDTMASVGQGTQRDV
jgi:hypothetical protein